MQRRIGPKSRSGSALTVAPGRITVEPIGKLDFSRDKIVASGTTEHTFSVNCTSDEKAEAAKIEDVWEKWVDFNSALAGFSQSPRDRQCFAKSPSAPLSLFSCCEGARDRRACEGSLYFDKFIDRKRLRDEPISTEGRNPPSPTAQRR